jgi:hypothetical protein
MKRLWTFHVRNGDPFQLTVKGNPPVVHDGKQSLLKCLCTQDQAEDLETEMRSHGCTVKSNLPHETEEQREQREHILHVLGDSDSFPCVRCPECAWFDPFTEGLCGAGMSSRDRGFSWEGEVIQERLTDLKFLADWKDCPLNPQEMH